jgi:hypothetical protein
MARTNDAAPAASTEVIDGMEDLGGDWFEDMDDPF